MPRLFLFLSLIFFSHASFSSGFVKDSSVITFMKLSNSRIRTVPLEKYSWTSNGDMIVKKREQKLYVRTKNGERIYGYFKGIRNDSLLLSLLDNQSEMVLSINDLRFIQIYRGKGTRFASGVLLTSAVPATMWASFVIAFEMSFPFGYLGGSFDDAVLLWSLPPIALIWGGIALKGKRYRMEKWEVSWGQKLEEPILPEPFF